MLSNGLENAQKRQRDMYLDLDTRLRRIEQQSGGDAAQSGGPRRRPRARVKRLEQQRTDAERARPQLAELEARIKRLEQQTLGAGTSRRRCSADPAANPAAGHCTTPARYASLTAPTPPTRTDSRLRHRGALRRHRATDSVRKAYDSGFAAYRAGDYQGAIAAFDGIVKRYPRDPLAPNAQYWIGDAWFNLRDFKSAAAAQQALITNYPDSPKVPTRCSTWAAPMPRWATVPVRARRWRI